MTEEKQSEVLARWLDGPPGATPPEDLDDDVVEAVVGLRPDLAAAPSLTADDILASVTRGPLANRALTHTPVGGGGELVELPFVGAAAEESRRRTAGPSREPQKRWWASANRWGGLGVVVAMAATLLLVALPLLNADEAAPLAELAPSPAADELETQRAASSAPMADAAPEAPAPPVAQNQIAPPEATVTAASRVAEIQTGDLGADVAGAKPLPVARQPVEEVDAVADVGEDLQALGYLADDPYAGELAEDQDLSARDMAAAGPSPSDIIPEAEAARSQMAGNLDVAEEGKRDKRKEAAKPSASPKQAAPAAGAPPLAVADEPAELPAASSRSLAQPKDLGSAWRRGLDGLTAAKIDDANRVADAAVRAGDPAGAAEALLPVITPPAEAGQVQAARAVQLFLQAGRGSQAVAVARQGLALSTANTAARSALLVVYGDALTATGDAAGAEQAWREAAALNGAR